MLFTSYLTLNPAYFEEKKLQEICFEKKKKNRKRACFSFQSDIFLEVFLDSYSPTAANRLSPIWFPQEPRTLSIA